MPSPLELNLSFVCPIPVGQHVTVRWCERAYYDSDDATFVAGWVPMSPPMVRHDETGIVYCLPQLTAWVEPSDLSLRAPGAGHRHTARLAHGRVSLCVVGTRPGDEQEAILTRLSIVLPGSEGYR